MDELTEKQARTLYGSKFWEEMTKRERAVFQLNTPRLCMPFDVFHEALEAALGRSVWTHELGLNTDGIRRELAGEAAPPTFAEIVALIPESKRVLVLTSEST